MLLKTCPPQGWPAFPDCLWGGRSLPCLYPSNDSLVSCFKVVPPIEMEVVVEASRISEGEGSAKATMPFPGNYFGLMNFNKPLKTVNPQGIWMPFSFILTTWIFDKISLKDNHDLYMHLLNEVINLQADKLERPVEFNAIVRSYFTWLALVGSFFHSYLVLL